MSIANLANIPSDDQSLLNWSFAHMDHHRRINDAIQRQFGGALLPLYPIDPIRPFNLGVFLYQHQQMHTKMIAALNAHGGDINALDLLDVDWKDNTQRQTWIFQNFTEHFQASQQLGIG